MASRCDHLEYVYQELEEKLVNGIKEMDLHCVQRCITEGAHVNYQNKDGRTPLIEAAAKGDDAIAIVRMLLNKGALPGVSDQNGLTALMVASQSGSRMVVKELLQGGALECLYPEQATSDQIKKNVCTVLEYLNGRERPDEWTAFIECLNKTDHSLVAANLEEYVPEAFTESWSTVSYKRRGRDPVTEDLRKKMERLSRLSNHPVLDEPNLKSQLRANPYTVVFAGSSTEKEFVRFAPHKGPFIEQHRGRTLYEPTLLKVSGLESGFDHFRKYFHDEIQQVNLKHNEQVHGRFVMHGRLGKLYIFGNPDVEKMTIAELNEWQHVWNIQMGGGRIRWAFAPADLSHERLKLYLADRGFELYNTERRYILNLKIGPHEYRAVFDEQLQYIETRYRNVKWLALTLKRADAHRKDIRMDITTTHKVSENSEIDNFMRRAKLFDIVNDKLIVRPEYVNVCVFLRHKETQMYRQKMDTKSTFATEVHLVKARNNTFKLEKEYTASGPWGTEAIVLPALPQAREQEVMGTFSDDFLKFCSDLDQAAG